jgi:uncharacterized membrane protein
MDGGKGKEPGQHSGPENAQLMDTVRDLLQRVERLECMAKLRPPTEAMSAPVEKPTQPSLESRLGSQYLNRAGIIALLVGVSFAVHWVFTNDWISAGGIVVAGLIGGLAIVALGEWFMRRRYAAFGMSLDTLGIGALYLVAWAGYQVYRVVPGAAALVGMIVITAATAVGAMARDSELLAIFAFLGGFATPLLLSAGQNRQVELYVYLLVLSAGMVLTLLFRGWSGLLVASFFACVAVIAAWFFSHYSASQRGSTLVFNTMLFAMFIAGTLLVKRQSNVVMVIASAATAAYLLAARITAGRGTISGIEALVAAGLLVVSWLTLGRVRALYITLVVGCFALAIAAKFGLGWTTSALWLVLGAALMLLGFRTGVAFVRWDALVLIAITIVKVFAFDLARLAAGERILATVALGVVLLAISFVYQRNWLRVRP